MGVVVLFSTSAESVFKHPKHSQRLSLDSVKLQPKNLTTWQQYQKMYSFRYVMALIKSSEEFLNRGSSFLLSDFTFLPWCPFLYWPDYLHVAPLFYPCSCWLTRVVTGRSMQLQSLQLVVLPANLPVQQMDTGTWDCCAAWLQSRQGEHCGTGVCLLHLGQWEFICHMFPQLIRECFHSLF